MQIVRCFRDEDPRADRQAEFTQLDVEMAFIDRENIISIMEGLLRRIWKEILNVEIPNPIPHMEYDEAMSKYGSDRPDLRFGMELHDITDLGPNDRLRRLQDAPMVKAIVVPGGAKLTRKETDALAEWSKGFGAKGLAVTKVTAQRASTPASPNSSRRSPPKLIERTGAKEGDLLCFAADRPKIVHKVLGELRLKMARDLQMKPSTEFAWVWVVNFPLFEWDEEEKRLRQHASSLHRAAGRGPGQARQPRPRSRRVDQEQGLRHRRQRQRRSAAARIRIHRMDVQQKVFALLGIDDGSAEAEIRLPAGRPPIRRPAARRHRAGPRPPGHDPPRHHQHPRRHRLPQNPKRRRPDVRLPLAGGREAAARRRTSASPSRQRSRHDRQAVAAGCFSIYLTAGMVRVLQLFGRESDFTSAHASAMLPAECLIRHSHLARTSIVPE